VKGRPKSDIPSATVCTWLPAPEHDRLIALARQQETSVSYMLRLATLFLLEKSRRLASTA
jgi:hypothetical protein